MDCKIEISGMKFSVFGSDYYVDENGTVVNKYGKVMAKYIDRKGYSYIVIRRNKMRKKILVHRLVAEMFIENPLNLPQVNHIDGDKTNSNVSNLEWVTASENQIHSRYVLKNRTGFSDTPVVCVETGIEYISTRDAWRKTGVNCSHISECVNGKRKTAGGYHWKNRNTGSGSGF